MKKKGISQKSEVSSNKFPSYQTGPPITKQTFWFRLWIGFLVGVFGVITLGNVFVLLTPNLRVLMPMNRAITFSILGIALIYSMVMLLKSYKCGLYGTIGLIIVYLVFNVIWGASIGAVILYAALIILVTLLFVVPYWRYYK